MKLATAAATLSAICVKPEHSFSTHDIGVKLLLERDIVNLIEAKGFAEPGDLYVELAHGIDGTTMEIKSRSGADVREILRKVYPERKSELNAKMPVGANLNRAERRKLKRR